MVTICAGKSSVRERQCPRMTNGYRERRRREVIMANDNIIMHRGVVSIIVPCCGMLEYTKPLVPSHVERLGGFCVLLKRQVLDKIGMVSLEKWTDLSLFDTDILSTKARQAGFTLAVCRDLFIHHFGTRTFSGGASATTDRKPQELRHARQTSANLADPSASFYPLWHARDKNATSLARRCCGEFAPRACQNPEGWGVQAKSE
jgi:hypothetical protein